MPTYTTNYHLAKPLVNSAVDQDLWGDELNSDMDIIDSTMKTISDSVVSLSTIYPIGSVYINYSDSTNPATLFGFGTWVAITDRFLISASGTYPAGSTGGATTVSLTEANNGPHTHNTAVNSTDGVSTTGFQDGAIPTGRVVTTSSSGSGAPFSILPPYVAVYMWRRTA